MSGAPNKPNAVEKAQMGQTTAARRNPTQSIAIKSFDDLMAVSNIMYKGGLAQGCGKPEAVACKIMVGMELGLKPGQAIASIMLVNGKPSVYGDAVPGLAISSGLMDGEPIEKEVGTPGTDSWGWTVTVKRKGSKEPNSVTYTLADAKRTGLYPAKAGSAWANYTSRMMLWRARGTVYRDAFPDLYTGLVVMVDDPNEEPVKVEVTGTRVDTSPANALPAAPTQPAANGPTVPTMPATVTASQPVLSVDGVPMIDDEQLHKMSQNRPDYLKSKGVDLSNKESASAAWKSFLSRWGVESAKSLTHDQAKQVLAELYDVVHANDPLAQRLATG